MSGSVAERTAARRFVIALLVAMPLAALAWGWIAGERPMGARPAVIVTPVDAAWYAALPRDPAAATSAPTRSPRKDSGRSRCESSCSSRRRCC